MLSEMLPLVQFYSEYATLTEWFQSAFNACRKISNMPNDYHLDDERMNWKLRGKKKTLFPFFFLF